MSIIPDVTSQEIFEIAAQAWGTIEGAQESMNLSDDDIRGIFGIQDSDTPLRVYFESKSGEMSLSTAERMQGLRYMTLAFDRNLGSCDVRDWNARFLLDQPFKVPGNDDVKTIMNHLVSSDIEVLDYIAEQIYYVQDSLDLSFGQNTPA